MADRAQWEYRLERYTVVETDVDAVARFNRLGADGWQVFHMFGYGGESIVWMRREIVG